MFLCLDQSKCKIMKPIPHARPANSPKRSVTISGHRTSVSVEPEFWNALTEISKETNRPLAQLINDIDKHQARGKNLSSALRVFVLAYFRNAKA